MKRPDPNRHYEIGANIAKMRKAGLSHQQALAVALQWQAKKSKRLQNTQKTDTVNLRQDINPPTKPLT